MLLIYSNNLKHYFGYYSDQLSPPSVSSLCHSACFCRLLVENAFANINTVIIKRLKMSACLLHYSALGLMSISLQWLSISNEVANHLIRQNQHCEPVERRMGPQQALRVARQLCRWDRKERQRMLRLPESACFAVYDQTTFLYFSFSSFLSVFVSTLCTSSAYHFLALTLSMTSSTSLAPFWENLLRKCVVWLFGHELKYSTAPIKKELLSSRGPHI